MTTRCTPGKRQNHRSYYTLARCGWPTAAWVTGDGEWAVLAPCRALTVSLWQSQDKALNALEFIDASGCGGQCSPVLHSLWLLDLPEHGAREMAR